MLVDKADAIRAATRWRRRAWFSLGILLLSLLSLAPYLKGPDDVAVSALAFRQALLSDPDSIESARMDPGARPGYAIEEKMWAWYRNDLPGWGMAWGNNVFSLGRVPTVCLLGRFFEQLDANSTGTFPRVSLMVTQANQDQVDALWRLCAHLFIVVWLGSLAMLVARAWPPEARSIWASACQWRELIKGRVKDA